MPKMGRLAVLLFLTTGADAAQPGAGFVPYPGARPLCAEHVSGTPLHITWSSYATPDRVEIVVTHYEKTTGRKATTLPRGERRLEWNANHTLGIYPAADNDRFPHCETKPTRDERTIILISTAVGAASRDWIPRSAFAASGRSSSPFAGTGQFVNHPTVVTTRPMTKIVPKMTLLWRASHSGR